MATTIVYFEIIADPIGNITGPSDGKQGGQ